MVDGEHPAMVRRLAIIAERNAIRHAALLPPLSVAKEWRCLLRQEDLEEFEKFYAVHGATVTEQVLKARRIAKPNFIVGMAISNDVKKILKAQLRALKKTQQHTL
jgi:hypothetical protein